MSFRKKSISVSYQGLTLVFLFQRIYLLMVLFELNTRSDYELTFTTLCIVNSNCNWTVITNIPLPRVFWNLSQALELVCPSSVVVFPGGHSLHVHWAYPSGRYCPLGQGLHPSLLRYPLRYPLITGHTHWNRQFSLLYLHFHSTITCICSFNNIV